MNIHVVEISLTKVPADWLILGLWENEPWDDAVAQLDAACGGLLTRLRERGDVTGKAKELTPLWYIANLAAPRLLLVGLGSPAKADAVSLIACAAAACKSLTGKSYPTLAMALPDHPTMAPDTLAYVLGIGLRQGCEGPGLRKTKPERFAPKDLVLVVGAAAQVRAARQGAARAEVEGGAVSLARELVNLPPCDLYPESFADRARRIAQESGVACQVLDEMHLYAERMHALLAVARGSEKPPRLVVLRYGGGGASAKTLGLVGKGVTFDSGGLSLKTNDQMVDMKCDMAGAAAVLSAIQAIAGLKLPVNVVGVLALVENLPSGKAMKLGDVVYARNGKSIEVLNTDAEGRLILADALAYAIDQKVDHLVDLATLTGACMVALGCDVAGLLGNEESWAQRVQAAAGEVGELVWPLPTFSFFGEMIKSDVADIKNTGGTRNAGAITAAKFLEEFVAGVPWVHLDIAGPAWVEKDSAVHTSGGTGCFVRTLVELARGYNR